ncbi:hypothetical protein ACLB2K_058530 [Fragaria x ananassa]
MFKEEEEQGIRLANEDPFLITAQLDHYLYKKILIDTGADVVQHLGSDYIPMILGGLEGNALRTTVDFIIVDCDSSYNGILGRPALWKIKAFIAGHMLIMKLPSPTGVVTIQGDQLAARGCYTIDRDNGRKRAEVLASGSTSKLMSDVYE